MTNSLQRLLVIETATERASVALLVQGHLESREHVGSKSHAQAILGSVDELLKQADVSLSQLDGIVFGCGPGSFTGLRVACSIAKGLAYGHDLPLYPVSSLAAIMEEAQFLAVHRDDNSSALSLPVLAMIDARMQQVYWTSSLDGHEQVSFVRDIELPGTSDFILAGVGWEHYEQEFPAVMTQRLTQRWSLYPSAFAMVRLVLRGVVQPVSASEAQPVYVRNQVTS